jgi:hopene-associated glycosyltransferase HpnB
METIEAVLAGLETQGCNLDIILVDDQSTDATAEVAQKAARGRVRILSGAPLPPGWSGKLWALEQGRRDINTPLTLLIDADIELMPGILVALLKMMRENGLQFVSLMAALRMASFWERLLMPAFVYFFKLLYPFRLANSPSSKVAAAAGGCILLETRLLNEIGGFEALQKELIDDCALAKKVKSQGWKTWIGLTHSVRSLRPYTDLGTIWNMVARNAFTQLDYSRLLLALCTGILLLAFWFPVAGLVFGNLVARYLSTIALGGMMLSYMPILRFYGISTRWALTVPVIGTLYLGMTWTSAIRYWEGKRSQWKGRTYIREAESR